MTRARRLAIAGGLLAAIAGVFIGTRILSGNADQVILASGTVEATEADLGFQTPGRIDSIAVQEGAAVTPTQELAWLDRAELRARRQAAAAQAAAARARLAELEHGSRPEEIAQGRAALRAAEQRLEDARRDLERMQRLYDGGAASRQQLDHQQTTYELAMSQHDTAKEQLALLEQGPRAETIAAQQAALSQAVAAVAQVDAALGQAVIRAPMPGIVTLRHREPGETVPAGLPVVTVMNPDDRWVRIYVRQDQVGRLAIGQAASITADAYPERRYGGEVVFIAREAEFTPRNVQTAAERVKLVYRVKVRVTDDPGYDLKPGLPADVRLEPALPRTPR